MATKINENENERITYVLLHKKRGLQLARELPKKKDQKYPIRKNIIFQNGQYITNDKELIKYLDEHEYRMGSQANIESGVKPDYARLEDVRVVGAHEHKEIKEALKEKEKENELLLKKVEDLTKKIRAEQQKNRRDDKKNGSKEPAKAFDGEEL